MPISFLIIYILVLFPRFYIHSCITLNWWVLLNVLLLKTLDYFFLDHRGYQRAYFCKIPMVNFIASKSRVPEDIFLQNTHDYFLIRKFMGTGSIFLLKYPYYNEQIRENRDFSNFSIDFSLLYGYFFKKWRVAPGYLEKLTSTSKTQTKYSNKTQKGCQQTEICDNPFHMPRMVYNLYALPQYTSLWAGLPQHTHTSEICS